MNFYKEIEHELNNAGILGSICSVPEELKPTSEDYADLERRIGIKVHENEIMMAESKLFASQSYC